MRGVSKSEVDSSTVRNPNVNIGVVKVDPHYSVAFYAELWNVDASTVRKWFQDRAGVLKFGKEGRRDGRRDYVNLRIPWSVAWTVYHEMSQ